MSKRVLRVLRRVGLFIYLSVIAFALLCFGLGYVLGWAPLQGFGLLLVLLMGVFYLIDRSGLGET